MITEATSENRKRRISIADIVFCFICQAQTREGPWVQAFTASVGVGFLIAPSLFSALTIAIELTPWLADASVEVVSNTNAYIVASAISIAIVRMIYRSRRSRLNLSINHPVIGMAQTIHGRLLGASVFSLSVAFLVILSVRSPAICILISPLIYIAPGAFLSSREPK